MRVEWPTAPEQTPEELKEALREQSEKVREWLRVAEAAHEPKKSTLHFGPGPRPK